MSAPTTWGHYRLPARLALYRQLHPDVQIELNITNRNVDIIAEGFDLVVRQGHLPDSGLVAKSWKMRRYVWWPRRPIYARQRDR